MLEFFRSNATAVISASGVLFGALIAGSVAIAGNVLNFNANNRVRESQFELEKWKANRSLFLDRGEEAIGLLSRVSSHYLSFNNTAVTEAIGDNGGKISENVIKALSNKEIPNALERLDAIITAYFPDLSSLKSELVRAFQASTVKYFEHKLGKYELDETALSLLKSSDLINQISNKLKEEISQEMGKHL